MHCAQTNLISLPQSKKFLFREFCLHAKQALDIAEVNGKLEKVQEDIQAQIAEHFML